MFRTYVVFCGKGATISFVLPTTNRRAIILNGALFTYGTASTSSTYSCNITLNISTSTCTRYCDFSFDCLNVEALCHVSLFHHIIYFSFFSPFHITSTQR